MKPENEDDALLKDVFGEAAPPSLRDSMLGESLRAVRRQRRNRRLGRAGALLAVLGLGLAALLRQSMPRHQNILTKASPAKVEQSYTLVRSQSLPATAIVTTKPMSSGQFIGAETFAGIVRTRSNSFRTISDDELLALLSPHPCALVRIGPNSEKLVFVNPDDAKGFPLN